MRVHDLAFYTASFFILGVLLASLKLDFLIIITAVALAAALILFFGYLKNSRKFFWLAGLFLFIIVGAFYYFCWDNYQTKNLNLVFDKKINFDGLVIKDPEQGDQQKLVVKLKSPYSGKILVKLRSSPSFDYGDIVNFEGIIKKPEPLPYANSLAKDGIFGVMNYPQAELLDRNQGSIIKSQLFKLKKKIIVNFQKTLPAEKAAFLSGITLGERAEFSQKFKEAMSKSGTTHLVALSGYNISVIVIAMFALFNYFLSRRLTFFLTILVIFGFVLMTGAEASVVRAAIMGFIALLAKEVGRLYSSRNAIALAAFFMVLINPKVLFFDIGFQLSFLALLGIVYLGPAIQKFFKMKSEEDFLGWRENFLTTLSAQLAVAPLLIVNFGNFSYLSLIANLLILVVIPLTMSLGFILAGLGFISYYFSLIFAWFVNLFLSYELLIINFFGKLNIGQLTKINIFLFIVYYVFLIIFILVMSDRLVRPKNLAQSNHRG